MIQNERIFIQSGEEGKEKRGESRSKRKRRETRYLSEIVSVSEKGILSRTERRSSMVCFRSNHSHSGLRQKTIEHMEVTDLVLQSERRNSIMEMCYDGTLVMPQNFSVVTADEMEYIDGGLSVSAKWYGVCIHFTSRDLEGLSYALATGSGASWLAAELGAPTVFGGITFGAIAAGLATLAGATALLNWALQGKGITYHMTWIGANWISVD